MCRLKSRHRLMRTFMECLRACFKQLLDFPMNDTNSLVNTLLRLLMSCMSLCVLSYLRIAL